MSGEKRKAGGENPRLPWGGPISGSGGKPNPYVRGRRAVRNLLGLLNPVAWALSWVLTVVVTRPPIMRRVRGWWVAAAGVVAVAAMVLAGGARAYLRPWADIARVVGSHLTHGLGPALWALGRTHWWVWVVAQLPIAAALAVGAAGVVLWHRQRYTAGWRVPDDDAMQAWERMTPRQVSRAQRRAERAPCARVTDTTRFEQLRMRLGIDETGRIVRLNGDHFRSHMVVLAPTGYGKTVTLVKLLQGWLVDWAPRRLPAVLIDLKGSPEVLSAARAMCAATGRRCRVVTLRAATDHYNPLRYGTAPEVASRVLSALANGADGGFSEPHHRVVGQRWLNLAVAVLDALIEAQAPRKDGTPWRRDLHHLAELMRPKVLTQHAAGIDGVVRDRAADLAEEIEETKDLAKSIAGMRQRLANLVETGAGHVLMDDPDGVDLHQVIRSGDVVVFSLSTGRNREAVQTLGNLLVADLAGIFADLQEARWADTQDARALVVLDEFGALGGTGLVELIERARSAGGTCVISAQTEANFTEVSAEFKQKVYSNSDVWMLGRQQEEAAEARAKAIGTKKAWQETLQVTEDADPLGSVTGASGVGSLRRVDEFKISPNELRNLDTGQIILRLGRPPTLKRVRITLPRKWEPTQPAAPTRSTTEPTVATTVNLDKAPQQTRVKDTARQPVTAPSDPWAELDGDEVQEW